MNNSNFCRGTVIISCGLVFLFLFGCTSTAHINNITISKDIVSAAIKDMPLGEVLTSLDAELQRENSKYSIRVLNTNYWNGTRLEVKYPFTDQEEYIIVPKMPLITFSSNASTLEAFVKELQKQSRWSMGINFTNDTFFIIGLPVGDEHSRGREQGVVPKLRQDKSIERE